MSLEMIKALKNWINEVHLNYLALSTEEKIGKCAEEAIKVEGKEAKEKSLGSRQWKGQYFECIENIEQGETGHWKYRIEEDAELKSRMLNLMEFIQGDGPYASKLKGKIETSLRTTLSPQSGDIRYNGCLYSTAKRLEAKLFEFYKNALESKKSNSDSLLDGEGWLPETIKKRLIIECISNLQFESYVTAAYPILGKIAQTSGCAAIVLLNLLKTKDITLPEHEIADILQISVSSSGLSTLPYLLDLFPDPEKQKAELSSLVLKMLRCSRLEHVHSFTKREVMAHLTLLQLNESRKILEALDRMYPEEAPIEEDAAELTKDLKTQLKWIMNDPTSSHYALLKETLQKIHRRFDKEDAFKIKSDVLQKFKKRGDKGTFFFKNLDLLEFTEDELYEILKVGSRFKTYRPEVVGKLTALPWAKEKEELLIHLVAYPEGATRFLNTLEKFHIDPTNSRHIEIVRKAAQQCTDFYDVPFNFDSQLSHMIFGFGVQSFLKQKADNSHTGWTIFSMPPDFLFKHPHMHKLKPLFKLAALMAPLKDRPDIPINDKVYSRHFLASCKAACAALSENECLEVGQTLAALFKTSGAERILKEMGSMQRQDDVNQAKAKELLKALQSFAFDSLFTAYLSIFASDANKDKNTTFRNLFGCIPHITKACRKDTALSQGVVSGFCSFFQINAEPPLVPDTYNGSSFEGIFPTIFLLLSQEGGEKGLEWVTNNSAWIKTHFSEELCSELANSLNVWFSFEDRKTVEMVTAFIFERIALIHEESASPEKVEEEIKRMLTTFTVLFGNKEIRKGFAEELPHKDFECFFAKMTDLFSTKFGIDPKDHEKLVETLRTWQDPHLLMRYFNQWKNRANIVGSFARWFRAVVSGTTSSLRFDEGLQGEYFAKFKPDFVKWHRSELEINIEELKEHYYALKKEMGTKEFVQKFKAVFAPLLQWDNLPIDLSKAPKKFWADKIKEIKKAYPKDSEKQKKESARLKLLQNLTLLENETNPKKAWDALIKIQEYMGQYSKNGEIHFEDKKYNKLHRKIVQLKGNIQERIQDPMSQIRIRWTHDPETAFNISNVMLNSCQSVIDGGDFNRALMGRVSHGKQKLMIVEDAKTGIPIAACTTKFLQPDSPLVLMEQVYQCRGCALSYFQLDQIITFALLRECEKAKVPLVRAKVDEDKLWFENRPSPLFSASPYGSPITSETGDAGLEYEDAGRMQIQNKPEYTIDPKFLLLLTSKESDGEHKA